MGKTKTEKSELLNPVKNTEKHSYNVGRNLKYNNHFEFCVTASY
jgi:hypothetical protein